MAALGCAGSAWVVEISAIRGTSTVFTGAATAGNGQVVFSSIDAYIGVFDPTTRVISYVDIGVNHFQGAAAVSSGLVILVPGNANGVGVFDAATSTFKLVDISATVDIENKFDGATLAGNDLVVFAPSAATGVGVFNAATARFTYTDISMTVSTASKFSGAATASNGKVVLAPHDADGVGVGPGEPGGV